MTMWPSLLLSNRAEISVINTDNTEISVINTNKRWSCDILYPIKRRCALRSDNKLLYDQLCPAECWQILSKIGLIADFLFKFVVYSLGGVPLTTSNLIHKNELFITSTHCIWTFWTLLSIRSIPFWNKIYSLKPGAHSNQTPCNRDPV